MVALFQIPAILTRCIWTRCGLAKRHGRVPSMCLLEAKAWLQLVADEL